MEEQLLAVIKEHEAVRTFKCVTLRVTRDVKESRPTRRADPGALPELDGWIPGTPHNLLQAAAPHLPHLPTIPPGSSCLRVRYKRVSRG